MGPELTSSDRSSEVLNKKYYELFANNSEVNTFKFLKNRISEVTPFLDNKPLSFNNENNLFNFFINNAKQVNIYNSTFSSIVHNYYMTDLISKASPVMSKCSDEFVLTRSNYLNS